MAVVVLPSAGRALVTRMVLPSASLISQRWLSTMRLIRRNSSTVRVLLVAGVMILRASSPVVSILTMPDLRWLCRPGALPAIDALESITTKGGGSWEADRVGIGIGSCG